MSQAQLGELCGKSGRTIQAVELGKLGLSEGLALRIAQATGVSIEWLLKGDPKAPAKANCPSGTFSPDAAYTFEVFEAHRAVLEIEKGAAAGQGRVNTVKQVASLHGYHEDASKRDADLVERVTEILKRDRVGDRALVVRWRLKRFLDELDAQKPKLTPDQRKKNRPARHGALRS